METFLYRGSYDKCRTCGNFGWSDSHKCPPVYRVWCPADDETDLDARTVHATSAESAAEGWARRHDEDAEGRSAIYAFPHDGVEVVVRGPDGKESRWMVTGELEPTYAARELP